jgi:hypothetical protein
MKLPLSLKGTRSETITSIITFKPPDPMPCMALSAINILPLIAPPQIPLPRVKMETMKNVSHRLPKISAT